MYNSCKRTALTRSNIGLTPRDLQEDVLERRLLHLDVGDPDAAFAEAENELRNQLLRGVDHHGVVLREPEPLRPFREERRDGVAFAFHGEAQLRRTNPLGKSERGVLGE